MVKYYITKSHSQKIIHYFYCLLQKISHSEFLWKPGMGPKEIFSPVMQFEEKKRGRIRIQRPRRKSSGSIYSM